MSSQPMPPAPIMRTLAFGACDVRQVCLTVDCASAYESNLATKYSYLFYPLWRECDSWP